LPKEMASRSSQASGCVCEKNQDRALDGDDGDLAETATQRIGQCRRAFGELARQPADASAKRPRRLGSAWSRHRHAEGRLTGLSSELSESSSAFEGSPPTQAAAAPPENANVDEEAVADDSIKIGRSTSRSSQASGCVCEKTASPWVSLVQAQTCRGETHGSPTQSSPRLAASRRRNGRSSLPAGDSSRRRPNGGMSAAREEQSGSDDDGEVHRAR
jgi:hypothetical protein